ncbi:hypothetical protein NQ318_002615 [Aromia moschata]|uniref:Cytochrome P450 n=1 Tax=Aromia moschata TaxID=1265417 RepID=A0AAV8XY40_9CUCU|nr:hypothetical protein NQ318_002615 [Aromia moschata]
MLEQKRMIIASNYEFLEFVLSSTKILNKSSEYKYLESWLGNGLLTSTVKRWKKSRKVLTPAFHFSILEEFVSTFETNGKIMIDLLAKEVDKDSVDIYPYVRMCTLDIICGAYIKLIFKKLAKSIKK